MQSKNNDQTKQTRRQTTKAPSLKIDRWLRKNRRKLDRITAHLVKHTKRFLIGRLDHVRMVRREVVVWLTIVLLLIVGSFIQTILYTNQTTTRAAGNGGVYAEGVVDKLTTVNPLYANTDTEKAASQLIYPGLLAYDSTNKLHGDLAESWSVDKTGQIWTVKLKPDIKWADGHSLTTDDVNFTVNLMKDSNVNPTLSSSWQAINLTVLDQSTIEFKLSNPLMSFDTALTFGILPKHILSGKSALEIADLSKRSPNTIVGSGPLRLDKIESNNSIWRFKPSKHYYTKNLKISELIIHTYSDDTALLNGLKRGEVNAISSVKINAISQFDTSSFKTVQLKTSDGVYAIFNTDADLTSNSNIRQALRLGLDRNAIRNQITTSNNSLSAPTDLETPIATGVYSSIDKLTQPVFNKVAAEQLLDQSGWTIKNGDKYRTNSGVTLDINIVTISGTNYELVARQITQQWQAIGVNTKLESISANLVQQNYLVPRKYDVLVYQMHLGADPDMFAYWSLTQTRSPGLNLANYRSQRAEIALAGGRTNPNPTAREARYLAFANQWIKDNPAIALYQPSLFYVMRRELNTFSSDQSVIDASNRFASIDNWTVQKTSVMTTP